MYRSIINELQKWQQSDRPKPLLLRGARQVGKSYIVEKFASKNFKNFLSINFEELASVADYFGGDLDPELIIQKLALRFKTKISAGETLIFFDEIQVCPRAIQSLRFFYEKMPGLHIIGAGSLLEFALKSGELSVPVGRLQYLFMRPVSFEEYLLATNNSMAVDYISELKLSQRFDLDIHEQLLREFRVYMFLGGMPAVVQQYLDTKDLLDCKQEQSDILNTYKDDFAKYAKQKNIPYLDILLQNIPRLVGEKFKYSKVDRELRSEYLKEALWLLEKAQLVHVIQKTSGQAVPLAATASRQHFKLVMLDSGLTYRLLGLDEQILETSNIHNLAAGALAEQAVAQELAAYQAYTKKAELYYWERDGKESSAEVDYLHVYDSQIIGIEVKAGKTGKLKSLYQFMQNYQSKLGVRISQLPLSLDKGVLSVPIYAIKSLDKLISQAL